MSSLPAARGRGSRRLTLQGPQRGAGGGLPGPTAGPARRREVDALHCPPPLFSPFPFPSAECPMLLSCEEVTSSNLNVAGLEHKLYHLRAVCPRASHFISLSLSFFI